MEKMSVAVDTNNTVINSSSMETVHFIFIKLT